MARRSFVGVVLVAMSLLTGATTASATQAGADWTIRASAADSAWLSVAYGNGMFVAVSGTSSNNKVMTSTDGITWTGVLSGVNSYWLSVAYGNGMFVALAAAGSATTR